MLKFERSQYDSKEKERKKTGVKIEIDGWDSLSSLPSWPEDGFLMKKKMKKKCHGCSWRPSPWRRFF